MASFGEELRQQRELRQITLDEVSKSTKVNLRFLEALERDDFAALPGGLFIRGFIRAYATHIGADPEKLVNAYLFQVSQDHERADRDASRASMGPRLEVSGAKPGLHPQRLPRWTGATIGLVALIAFVAGVALLTLHTLTAGRTDGADRT